MEKNNNVLKLKRNDSWVCQAVAKIRSNRSTSSRDSLASKANSRLPSPLSGIECAAKSNNIRFGLISICRTEGLRVLSCPKNCRRTGVPSTYHRARQAWPPFINITIIKYEGRDTTETIAIGQRGDDRERRWHVTALRRSTREWHPKHRTKEN